MKEKNQLRFTAKSHGTQRTVQSDESVDWNPDIVSLQIEFTLNIRHVERLSIRDIVIGLENTMIIDHIHMSNMKNRLA